jgi:Ni/Co efflux regulator RcnB
VADEIGIQVIFTDGEVAVIQGYYQRQDALSKHKHKHKKNKGLPPGIAKNLQRGKSLPPGIAKQYLPGDLQRALPPVPAGYERIVVDGKILLIEIATQVVRDVLTDIVIG